MCECDAKIESVKSRIPETVYDFLTTTYQVYEEEYFECSDDDDPKMIWNHFESSLWDEVGDGFSGYVGDDESDPRSEIRNVCHMEIEKSLSVFKEFPHWV